MKLKLVPARQGLAWVRHGLRVFFMRPMAFCLLFLIFMFAMATSMLVVAPLATIAFMLATQDALQGRFPMPSVFIRPLRVDRKRMWAQIQLGVAYTVCAVGVYLVFVAIDGGAMGRFEAAMAAGRPPEELLPLATDSRLQAAWLVLFTGVAIISVPFWYAPALVHWGGMSAAKAAFFSTVACWRNKGALALYSLAWAGIVALLALFITTLMAALASPQMMFLMSPATLMVSAAFYASLFFTFADCFEPDRGQAVPLDAAPTETP